jgi:hypothetical protein
MEWSLTNILVVSPLVAWFFLSVLNQFFRGTWLRWILQYDHFALIPRWTFFAPNPGVVDWNILYRDRSIDGTLTVWYEVSPIQYGKWRSLWNPDKSIQKGISDMCQTLLFLVRTQHSKQGLLLQVPYIALLIYVCRQSRDPTTESRQFMIVQTDGYYRSTKPHVLFISAFHNLV